MRDTLRLTLTMALFTTLAAVVLVIADVATGKARQRADRQAQDAALAQVLPPFDNQPLAEAVTIGAAGREIRFCPGRRNGRLVAYAAEGTSKLGYGGPVALLVGLDLDGTILAVLATAHHETPGLGAPLLERRTRRSLRDLLGRGPNPSTPALTGTGSALPPCPFLDRFAGRRLTAPDALRIRRDGGTIDGVTGATVSSRAVTDAVNAIAQAFAANRAQLTGSGGDTTPRSENLR